jgi:GNAT superfamily N-acetyltransferase
MFALQKGRLTSRSTRPVSLVSLAPMCAARSATTLFTTGVYRAVELGTGDIPRLQRFFELNPEYFFAVNGQPPNPDEAHEEVHGALPDGWPFTKKWIIGFVDEAGSLIGMANVVSDLLAPTVWHIGLFMVATRLHGGGAAQALYQQLECWALGLGAQWLRLGVVQGNPRAERFWERCAFVEVRLLREVEMGKLVNTLRVMAKPLAAGTLPEYLALVTRDRSEPC